MEPHWETYFKNALRWWGGRNVFFFFKVAQESNLLGAWNTAELKDGSHLQLITCYSLKPWPSQEIRLAGPISSDVHLERTCSCSEIFRNLTAHHPLSSCFFFQCMLNHHFPHQHHHFGGFDPISRYTPNHEFLVMHPMKNNQSIQLSVLSSRWCLVFTMSFILSHPLPPH